MLGGIALGADGLILEIEFLPLGIEHVQVIGEAAIIALGRKLGRLVGSCKGMVEIFEALLLGPMGLNRIIDLLNSRDDGRLVTHSRFIALPIR